MIGWLAAGPFTVIHSRSSQSRLVVDGTNLYAIFDPTVEITNTNTLARSIYPSMDPSKFQVSFVPSPAPPSPKFHSIPLPLIRRSKRARTPVLGPETGQAAHDADHGEGPPAQADHAVPEPDAVPVARDDGADGAEGGAGAGAEAVHGAEHAGVGRRVVDEQDRARHGEGARADLQQQHERDAEPERAARRGVGVGVVVSAAGGGGGSGSGRGHGADEQRQVRSEKVGDREDEEGPARAPEQAVAGVDARVEQDLQDDAEEAEDGHGEAEGRGREGQAAGEVEGEVGHVRGVAARRGQKDEPERGEAAHLEVEDGDGEEDKEDVGRREDGADGGARWVGGGGWIAGGGGGGGLLAVRGWAASQLGHGDGGGEVVAVVVVVAAVGAARVDLVQGGVAEATEQGTSHPILDRFGELAAAVWFVFEALLGFAEAEEDPRSVHEEEQGAEEVCEGVWVFDKP